MITYIETAGISGEIVECGVHRGKSTLAIGSSLVRFMSERELWLYDSWMGKSEPVENDQTWLFPEQQTLVPGYIKSSWDPEATAEAVLWKLLQVGIPEQQIVFRNGWFNETFLLPLPRSVALLHVDCDYYQASFDVLETFYDLVSPGGVIVFDDFGHWPGQRVALFQFCADRGLAPLLERNGHSQAWFVKGKEHNRLSAAPPGNAD